MLYHFFLGNCELSRKKMNKISYDFGFPYDIVTY